MGNRTRRSRHAIQLLVMVGFAAMATFANEPAPLRSDSSAPLCYCQCSRERGAKHCTKMCELPKYEGRWWAKFCRKRNSITLQPDAPASNSGSQKTNRTEAARL